MLKENYVVHIRSLKETLNHELILKKVHKVVQFYQKTWLKPYIDMNTKLRKKAKMYYRDSKLVTTDKRRNRLVSESNYHTTKWFSENLLAIEMKKIKIKNE